MRIALWIDLLTQYEIGSWQLEWVTRNMPLANGVA